MKKLVLMATLAFSLPLFAQNYPINSDRPGQSFTPRTIERGLIQIQGGVDVNFPVSQFRLNPSPAPTADFRLGLANFLELDLGYAPSFMESTPLSNTYVFGLRGKILASETFALGVYGGIKHTMYQDEVLEDDALLFFRGLFDLSLGETGLVLFGNLGLETTEGTTTVPLTLGITGGSTVGWYAEYFANYGTFDAGINGGGFWAISDSFRLDLQTGYSSYNTSTDNVFAGLGFTWKPFNH